MIHIREATEADLEAILGIVNAGAAGSRVGMEAGDVEVYRETFCRISEVPEFRIFVATDENGEIIATYQWSLFYSLTFQGRPRAILESFHSRADKRGQGIGAAMLEHAVAFSKEHGCCMIQLTTNKQRVDAHRFYARHGFEATHEGFKRML
ncbi:GNAT family N-acetyltransferase [Pseudovibrio flavus]|uniref:GNAT family N-acetyltransferase n=1 Tax=Pseudovibrio flavus TaxID=2529854 RepID=UPI00211BFAF2|nr:GNAT family N-acetyltransferase [Pseudovibrio flavus]